MKHCTVPDCDRPHRSQGMCEMHYRRAWRAEAAKKRSENARAEATYRLDELTWLLDGGVWPPEAARRCGWTVAGAEKAARKQDREEIRHALYPFIGSGRTAVAA